VRPQFLRLNENAFDGVNIREVLGIIMLFNRVPMSRQPNWNVKSHAAFSYYSYLLLTN
jgi:hypothetical protein